MACNWENYLSPDDKATLDYLIDEAGVGVILMGIIDHLREHVDGNYPAKSGRVIVDQETIIADELEKFISSDDIRYALQTTAMQ